MLGGTSLSLSEGRGFSPTPTTPFVPQGRATQPSIEAGWSTSGIEPARLCWSFLTYRIEPQRTAEMSETIATGPDFSRCEGLLPAIAQDAATGEVLMLAYMNAEALQFTRETGQAHFWSRSRQELWRKGATSGHTQRLVEAYVDCDGDTLLLKVDQTGAACHTGAPSCFFRKLG